MTMRVIRPAEAGIPVSDRARRTAAFELLGLAAATIVIAAGVALTIAARPSPEYRAALRLPVAAFFGVYWAAHLFRRWRGAADDPVLLPTVHLLTGMGLVTMIALADPLRGGLLAERFAWGTAIGVAALAGASSIDLETSPLRRMVALPLVIALVLAAVLLVFGRGPGSSGVKVNLLGVQPVEAIRLLVILALAAFFARRIEFLRELSRFGLPRSKDVRPVLVAMALVLGFFFLQKDLGPALVLTFVFLGLYGVSRGRIAFVIVGILLLVLAFAVAYQFGVPPTVRQRVAIWLDPWSNGLVRGDQLAKGFWALATGGVTGTGPGLGDPQLVPAVHTDFVFAAIGEELGFTGLSAVAALYVLLCWRCLRAALRAPGDYTALLAIGIALGLVVQAFVITGGLLGLLPLSGVVTPFLSYGRSSMIVNCAAIGMVLAIAARAGDVRTHMMVPIRTLAAVLIAAGAAIVGRVAWIQIVQKDAVALAASLTRQGDGALRFEYNPRLLAAARPIERGTIFDRNGLPLATSRAAEIHAVANRYAAAGIRPLDACAESPRCYPLGGVGFHLLGDATTETNWAASNASFLERDSDARLKGWDDHPSRVDIRDPRTGGLVHAVRRDYRELLPLLRGRYEPDAATVKALLDRDRDVHSSIDARLQLRTATLLEQHIRRGGFARGAAVILDVDTGEVLAAASYPWPDAADLSSDPERADPSDWADRSLDRARYGLYPPGSTFKLLVAAAALRSGTSATFACVRLPDGRVGNYVAGSSRPIRDDPMDTAPHGTVDLHRGLIVSCNAYFAQLALRMGPKPLLDAASLFQIDMARPSTPAQLRRSLAYAGYGQGDVVVSPVKMARIAATIARQGRVVQARWLHDDTPAHGSEPRLLSASDASVLARDMRAVVVSGTGRVLSSNATAIAGKTGTAEVANGRSHSWFAGFAPYGGSAPHRVAFAVIIENAGYGSRAAAPLAGDLVSAARELGLFR
jgi:cell division protein FtsW (lipid II flippase)/cell division protein FtsI/penicillin-binding protein 2